MKRLPCFMHGAGLDCSHCKTADLWRVSLILLTGEFGHPIFMLDGVRCFPHTCRPILGKLEGSSWPGDSSSQRFPGCSTGCTKAGVQLGAAQRGLGIPFGFLSSCRRGSALLSSPLPAQSCCRAEVAALASKPCSNGF